MTANRVVITGATSGLGRELALQYAKGGIEVVLGVVGRRRERLETLAAELKQLGAEVHVYPVDVCDREAMLEMAKDFVEQAGGVDLVIANAGVGGPDLAVEGDPTPAARIIEVNVVGAINTLVPFLPAMKTQGSGHIVGIASVAAYRAFPKRGSYSASKIALKYLLESWDHDLSPHGIRTTAINPGFVVSEMTDSLERPQPFKMTTVDAVKRIRWAIEAERRVYTFPRPMRLVSWLLPWIPRWLVSKLS